ncbi:protein OS-9 [Histomonas meleagridis]|uniref:protein OS-9 n=1 Tax=Histomonas meleagridis TaxID=135588 RepID=UPI00355AC5A5|nr:protein OS-9 [Histomonas meleagridis]KAH0804347.1 protein OS-9 [Histomonas meleagridis]
MPEGFDSTQYIRSFQQEIGLAKYECYVKNVHIQQNGTNPEAYLRKKLIGNCFEKSHTNYWYFKFCPFMHLTQFRYGIDNVTRIDNFVLGKYSDSPMVQIDRGFSEKWNGGDICVVTGKPRTAQVDYICDLSIDIDGRVTSISEPSFCNYLVKFHTPHVCGFPNITNEELATIDCFNVDYFPK